ncbi:PA2779 family protein [Crenobacter cavernae]|uniref:PA2779 family protein n=1 Tax=Crenobacter cavernae TaxID=2290923 RepID=A0ABY0FHG9_9NEIS|nr:PA2779 family protein [Crenobacter cavernae]RXZ44263.1 hypothetical protein EBB06_06925 [Crenobacter cavernae]
MKLAQPLVAAALVVTLPFTGFTQAAQAAMIGVEQMHEATRSAEGDAARARVLEALSRANVVAELERQGVSPDQARDRVAALSDADARLLAEKVDKAPAGGIIGAILLVFFVLLLTDILGLTKVFPFTRSIR